VTYSRPPPTPRPPTPTPTEMQTHTSTLTVYDLTHVPPVLQMFRYLQTCVPTPQTHHESLCVHNSKQCFLLLFLKWRVSPNRPNVRAAAVTLTIGIEVAALAVASTARA
jgi:hypothetical protein